MSLSTRVTALAQAFGTDIKALFARSVPAGGAAGQVLAKTAGTDYAVGWTDAGGGAAPGDDGQVQYVSGGALAAAANVSINGDGDLVLGASPATAVPLDDTLILYTKRFGESAVGFMVPTADSILEAPFSLQPAFFGGGKIGVWSPPGSATTLPGVFGLATPTALGTFTSRSVATTNRHSRSRRGGYVSAATAGSLAGHYTPSLQFTLGDGYEDSPSGFFFHERFAISDAAAVSGARGFIGFTASSSAPTNVNPFGILNSVGLAMDGSDLYLSCRGSGSGNIENIGYNFPVMESSGITGGTVYDLFIYSPPNLSRTVTVELRRVGTNYIARRTFSADVDGTTAVPLDTVTLGYKAWRTNNATALAVGIDIMSYYIQTGY